VTNRPLALFHSGEAHVATFEKLIHGIDPEIPVIHRVRQDLLDAAQPMGLTPAIRREVADEILSLADNGAATVLCTCSTLGPGAESAADLADVPVMRVDRPMMERALDHGTRIAVAAALKSTVGPTRDLLERVAQQRGVAVQVREIVVEGAWPSFEKGDRETYWRIIAEALRREVRDVDAVVLAQASMAGAADLVQDIGVPILSSPRMGAEAAVRLWRSQGQAGSTSS
jgi:Asp/Glu/hydantoin racemase